MISHGFPMVFHSYVLSSYLPLPPNPGTQRHLAAATETYPLTFRAPFTEGTQMLSLCQSQTSHAMGLAVGRAPPAQLT